MATPSVHITNEYSGEGGFSANAVPATLLMDADAFLVSTISSALVFQGGPWKATINGKLTSLGAGDMDAAIQLAAGGEFKSTLTLGAAAEVTASYVGVFALHAVDIINKGYIFAVNYGIAMAGGTYKITNSGFIGAGFHAIDLTGAGTHTIVNSGTIEGPTAILANSGHNSVEKVTNRGVITGDIDLGDGADVLTNSGLITGGFS